MEVFYVRPRPYKKNRDSLRVGIIVDDFVGYRYRANGVGIGS